MSVHLRVHLSTRPLPRPRRELGPGRQWLGPLSTEVAFGSSLSSSSAWKRPILPHRSSRLPPVIGEAIDLASEMLGAAMIAQPPAYVDDGSRRDHRSRWPVKPVE